MPPRLPGCIGVCERRRRLEIAGERGYMLVSKDNDFQSLALSRGAPPKVVILLIGNGPTAHAEAVLRRAQTRLEDFADSEDTVLMLRDPFTFT